MSKIRIDLDVVGSPASQGSHAIMNGRIVQVNSAKHKAWRKAIVDQCPKDFEPIDEPCELIVNFYLERPATVKRGSPSVPPDLDKLIRSVGDALVVGGVLKDDSRIVRLSARKIYANGIAPGASIRVLTLD